MLAIVRIRGLKNVRVDIRQALDTLNLDRKNHCVLVTLSDKDKQLHKVKDYVAYGAVTPETVAKLIEKRGRIPGDKRVTLAYLNEKKIESFASLAAALDTKKTTLSTLGIKPVFRLNSPKKGFASGGIKRTVALKGPLGFHAGGLDPLVIKMM